MPRNDGSTQRSKRKRHLGHRMHRRTLIQRRASIRPNVRTHGLPAWGRGLVT